MDLFILSNEVLNASITNYGGRLISLLVPDRGGQLADVVLGFERLEQYVADRSYQGALIGRYGNRIARAELLVAGLCFQLVANEGMNTLHGGDGFDAKIWNPSIVENGIELQYTSPDGEAGFPGTLSTTVRYSVAGGDLRLDYQAVTDQVSALNLTHHAYFNLAGAGSGDVLSHEVEIFASYFTPVDADLIPTSEIRSVAGTPFDFRTPQKIGHRIHHRDAQLIFGRGYDHNWVLESRSDSGLTFAAQVYEPRSGRRMTILTSQPGLQFYSGNLLDGSLCGKGGTVYGQHAGFCMETQHFPDSPHHPAFPSTVLKPGEPFRSTTIYRFSAG